MVWAKSVTAWNMSISMFFGYSPKFTITCGKCGHIFACRTPVVNYPTATCPHCHELNKLNIIIS